LVLDHVVPHVRTKDDSEENLVTACRVCNSKKQDRTPEEAGMVLRTNTVE
jgi:5-methylcytosine-specific restriction endonuclease McrA